MWTDKKLNNEGSLMKWTVGFILLCLALGLLGGVARADDPCDFVNLIESGQAPSDTPHSVRGDYYAACALMSPAGTEKEFDMQSDAAREYAAQAKALEHDGNDFAAFVYYVKANDAYVGALLMSEKNGFGDISAIREQIVETGRGVKRMAPKVIPSYDQVPSNY